MNIKLLIPIIFVFILTSSCESENSNAKENTSSEYLAIYSGGYTIEVVGYPSDNDVETYALHDNGSAKWMHIVNDEFGSAKIMSEKSGKWAASEGKITVTIQGNTGTIVEKYVLKNDKFINTINADRYLKRTK